MSGQLDIHGDTVVRSFYVKRVSPEGKVGWAGSMRPLSRAEREAKAWRSCGWAAEVLPNTVDVRREVRSWERRAER